MSVLIKGMEMPRNCVNCCCAYYTEGALSDICQADEEQREIKYELYGNKPNWCPLVEVPTPHGRLIDADELEVDTEWSDYYDGYQSYSAMQIKYAPTVIESED